MCECSQFDVNLLVCTGEPCFAVYTASADVQFPFGERVGHIKRSEFPDFVPLWNEHGSELIVFALENSSRAFISSARTGFSIEVTPLSRP